MHKLILGLGGSSGSIYAKLLLERLDGLKGQYEEIGIVMSRNARINWNLKSRTSLSKVLAIKSMIRTISMRHLPAGQPALRQ